MSDWTPEAGTPPVSTPDDPVGEEPAGPGEDGAAGLSGARSFEPAEPAPLGVVRTPTGHAAVDARLERLADADHLPADGHIEVYEDVHRGLRAELTSLDSRPADAAPGPVRPGPAPSHRTHDTRHDNRS
ncbi:MULTISPECIES: hypothetical protein [Streptomyces]|uniref:Uncharacterized protein n=3 Tax=Streptomyces TaxID=1883 RepID=A0A927BN01_STRGL|nr:MULTISPECIES: hypothetical protein [Streptomyces]MBD2829973.1 hypothetical protein [Streptomyces globisporus]MYW78827.1 hypothetical protein [Streptomyces sp. SID8369]NEA12016.1 hypothetical protein [Streptomyces sp. SID10692]NEC45687.1 hypothetical protein [Streptomyces sp. SID8016]ARF60988.1 hypothetical protein B1H20_05930 [Streptomyces violaceoruber]